MEGAADYTGVIETSIHGSPLRAAGDDHIHLNAGQKYASRAIDRNISGCVDLEASQLIQTPIGVEQSRGGEDAADGVNIEAGAEDRGDGRAIGGGDQRDEAAAAAADHTDVEI